MLKLSESVVAGIRSDVRAGMSTRRIAAKYRVSQSSVARISRTVPEDVLRPKAGRPGRVSLTTRRLMVRNITAGFLDNAVQVQRFLKEELGVDISANRVRQILKEEDLTAQHKKKRPKLTKEHIKKRMEFVRRYEHWTVEDWKRVLWTDETKINRYGSDGTQWVWKNNKVGMQARLIEETLKHGGGSLMMWGCMAWDGPGFISHIEAGLDAKLYIEILDECVPLTQEYYGIHPEEMIFQQDNDPKHTAKITRRFFEDNEYVVLMWPPNSPDLNPIEHLWAHLKRLLARYREPPGGIPKLWERIQEVWNEIPASVCQNLIESMSRRIQAVKRARGRHTKY